MTMTMTEIRLYVGGLGEKVSEEDIKKTFSNLGCVKSVELIRSKGRSFAYINFFPSSLNSLPKLFSTYNGCSWKGGKLKLEKAKEHYLDRLKREWAEEAELKNNENNSHSDVDDASIVDSLDPQSTLDLKNMEFRLFFPKLRKVKPLPLSGTGKHKYSFRRLDGPPCPVHFCDCPEHSVPDQPHTVIHANGSDIRKGRNNKKEYTMVNSVRNSQDNYRREAIIHDSVIQEGGMNEEEVNMMDSVMKKLLEKGRMSSKIERQNLNISQKQTIQTSKIQEEANDIDDGTYDDDIKTNAIAGDDGTSFPNEEALLDEDTNDDDDDDNDDEDDIQINVVAGRKKNRTSLMVRLMNEGRNQDNLARLSKLGIVGQKVETSDRKRKSISTDSNADGLAYPIHEKVQSEPEPEPKRATTGMWSQKSAWKQLVGEGSSTSFTLSQITQAVDTNHEVCPKLANKLSSDIKKSKKARKVVLKTPACSKEAGEQTVLSAQRNKKSKQALVVLPEEPEPCDEKPSDSKEDERVGYCDEMGRSAEHDEKDEPSAAAGSNNKDLPKLGSKVSPRVKKNKKARKVARQTLTAVKEDEGVNNSNETSRLVQHDEKESPPKGSDKAPRGSSWLQSLSWTQLVGSNDSAFSISQILPENLLQKENTNKPDDIGRFSTISTGAFFGEQKTSEKGTDSSNSPLEKDDQEVSAARDVEVSKASRRGVEISESCPFMRNANSMKEWMSAKTAMNNSLKKMKNK